MEYVQKWCIEHKGREILMNEQSWENYYKHNERPWTEPDEMLAETIRRLKSAPGKAIDLGAGEGGNSFWLAGEGWDVTSIDSSPSAIKFISSESTKRGYSIRAEAGNILNYETDQKYDLVLIAYVHLPKQERKILFNNALKLLSKNGIMIYFGLLKSEESLPAGAAQEEFPASVQVAEELTAWKEWNLLEHEDVSRVIQIGHTQGSYEGTITKVIVQKGRDEDESETI
jgi:2-polyprenyl-3-methyl-5-hydroxy-6-metoxy-1,4-benzoquinol methylase